MSGKNVLFSCCLCSFQMCVFLQDLVISPDAHLAPAANQNEPSCYSAVIQPRSEYISLIPSLSRATADNQFIGGHIICRRNSGKLNV